MMNVLDYIDIGIVAILIFCVLNCFQKGFIRSLYGLSRQVLTIFLAWTMYPPVSRFLRELGFVYDSIYATVAKSLDLSSIVQTESLKAQNDFINGLSLPAPLLEKLVTNNNPVLYELFKASKLDEYIYAYITNICINVIAVVVSLVLVSIVLHFVLGFLDIVSKLPVINGLNKIGGILIGLIEAVLFIWIGSLVIMFFIVQGNTEIIAMVQDSAFTKLLFDYNLLLGPIKDIALP